MTNRDQIRHQLAQELAAQRQYLDAGPSDTLTGRIVRAQTEARISDVQARMTQLDQPILEIRLTGDAADRHRLPATTLSRILRRLQLSTNRIGWALSAGAKRDQSDPPGPVLDATAFDVVALANGSFRLVLEHPEQQNTQERLELDDDSLLEQTVRAIMDLLDAASSEKLDESTEELAARMGPAAAKSMRSLLRDLSDQGLTTEMSWKGRRQHKTQVVTPAAAKRLSDWLRSVQERTESITVVGTLHGGDDLIGRFKFVDVAGATYEGKADPDIIAGRRFGSTYTARIDKIVSITEHIGGETERFILRGLDSDPRDRVE